jgi:ketosteroid isomerase-like protein
VTDRERAIEFVERYGRTWQEWDLAGFVDLFSEDVVYVAHPIDETVVGRPALAAYVEKESRAQGEVSVRMGSPVIDGNRVCAEFWVISAGEPGSTIVGCLFARLEPDGRCSRFREYWFDVERAHPGFDGWGE